MEITCTVPSVILSSLYCTASQGIKTEILYDHVFWNMLGLLQLQKRIHFIKNLNNRQFGNFTKTSFLQISWKKTDVVVNYSLY